jgi:phospholipid/cholesterol/gamma-HCH transport system permease protein
MSVIGELGDAARRFVEGVGGVTVFFGRTLGQMPRAFARPGLIVDQVFNAGALSLIIIMFCGFFVGLVLSLQSYRVLERFGSEDALGGGTALALLKELGPVITALLFAGRAGTALASEIGLMRATDQLTAMEMMAVDPIRYVVAPRFIGGVVAMPLLAVIFISIGIFGAYFQGVTLLSVDAASFWSQMQSNVQVSDVMEGFTKGCVFGAACSLVAVYEGFNAIPTAEGVGRATTRTVVISAVLILVLDYMLSAALF